MFYTDDPLRLANDAKTINQMVSSIMSCVSRERNFEAEVNKGKSFKDLNNLANKGIITWRKNYEDN